MNGDNGFKAVIFIALKGGLKLIYREIVGDASTEYEGTAKEIAELIKTKEADEQPNCIKIPFSAIEFENPLVKVDKLSEESRRELMEQVENEMANNFKIRIPWR